MPAARLQKFRLEYRAYCRPFRQPLATAHGTWAQREGLVVRLTDTHGRTGYGEAAPLKGFGAESVRDDWGVLRRAGKQISVAKIKLLPLRLASLRWALDCAHAMLAENLFAPAGHHALSVAALLPSGPTAGKILAQRLAEGYRVFKWKVGVLPLNIEWRLLDELLAALPRGAKLRLDANGALDIRAFTAWLEHLHALGKSFRPIEFIEQPFPPARSISAGKQPRLLALSACVPIALDESVTGLNALRQAHRSRWPGPLVVKPSLLGDRAAFLRWRPRAGADLVYSSVFETSIGLHAALALAATDSQSGKRALGFGTLAAFPPDGLQLSAHSPTPRLKISSPAPEDFLEIWNRLPHFA